MWGYKHELRLRAKGPTDHFLKDGPSPRVWIWVKRLVEWKITPWRGRSCGGLGQPLLPRSTTKVISKTFPLSHKQGTTNDQFPPLDWDATFHQSHLEKCHEEIRTTEAVTFALMRSFHLISSILNADWLAWIMKTPTKSYFMIKEWQDKRVMGQVSPESSWE